MKHAQALPVLLLLAACAGSPASGSGPMTYDRAVAELRRPPTASTTTAEGDLVATWETEVPEGTRRLTMVFGKDRVLRESQVTTVPRRR